MRNRSISWVILRLSNEQLERGVPRGDNRRSPTACSSAFIDVLSVAAFAYMAIIPSGQLLAQVSSAAGTDAGAASRSGDSVLRFEVASVKRADSSGGRGGRGGMTGGPGTADPGRLSSPGLTLMDLIMKAYGVSFDQISGPEWLDVEKYAFAAVVPAGTTKEQSNLMLQNLLVERFKLSMRHEIRYVPGFDLVISKNGTRLKGVVPVPGAPPMRVLRPGDRNDVPVDQSGFYQLGYVKGQLLRIAPDGELHATYSEESMTEFAKDLSTKLGTRPVPGVTRYSMARVVDKTDLVGLFSFTLAFSPTGMMAPPPTSDSAGALSPAGLDLSDSLRRQLGLELIPAKMPVDFIVVDHVERVPTND